MMSETSYLEQTNFTGSLTKLKKELLSCVIQHHAYHDSDILLFFVAKIAV
jgi:hypothetical protein